MKQVFLRQGKAYVDEVPAPAISPGHILIQLEHSCISIGTEVSGMKNSGMPLWKRALKQPHHAKKALKMFKTSGIRKTRSMVKSMLEAGAVTGYSATGIVIEVASDVIGYQVGDRVAAAGAQCAHHAEIISVPVNLVVPVPGKVTSTSAATVTMGAIAMQGVRRAEPTLGETFLVIGLGLLGQITSQLLRANGVRVIGCDLSGDRIKAAEQYGLFHACKGIDDEALTSIAQLTHGHGVDGVIITAASASDQIVADAFSACRRKGRVVLVGDVGLSLNRRDFYQKEIDFLISCSYGPGRYDTVYEEQGLDYPLPYVRWTEQRNMQSYLELINDGRVVVDPLIEKTFPIEKAEQAYASLKQDGPKPLTVLLGYPLKTTMPERTLYVAKKSASKKGVGIALIGAGGYAKGMHLPNIQKLGGSAYLHAVMSRKGHNALGIAKQYHAQYATTDYQKILDDEAVGAVIITTRHDLHVDMTLQALSAGKHVLVEKPLSINQEGLDKIRAFYDKATSKPLLLTGFNRRFAKTVTVINDITSKRQGPMIMNYRMNAGFIAADHWVHGAEGGGRNVGEACHIYDLMTYLTNASVTKVSTHSISGKNDYFRHDDNFVVSISFVDGSIGNLIYTAMGNGNYPKETMEVFVDGKVLVLDNYQQVKGYGIKQNTSHTQLVDKGQFELLKAFIDTCNQGGDWPIPLWQQVQATEISFSVEAQLAGNK